MLQLVFIRLLLVVLHIFGENPLLGTRRSNEEGCLQIRMHSCTEIIAVREPGGAACSTYIAKPLLVSPRDPRDVGDHLSRFEYSWILLVQCHYCCSRVSLGDRMRGSRGCVWHVPGCWRHAYLYGFKDRRRSEMHCLDMDKHL
ncbi:uncharacterized protein EDB91DRAFT_501295 [Suillus paluster]|uniref:uncharacterized protein n=1 Tax=Suillus paluster TaxID=48578 RepID=UPI001B871700|nr:uncharacterized protein EDB91DRAFT_501295 [Suillus paluster]KAG1736669.1 hypothetical protein EDB91DRAFT_501295 [Suillus paluster]